MGEDSGPGGPEAEERQIRRGSAVGAGPAKPAEGGHLPDKVMEATVVKGFGRGSKVLGIPTANMDTEALKPLDMPTGIYMGYCELEGTIYKTVVSIGWNPYFDNKEKTVEPHLLHEFAEDFYGSTLRLVLCGYIRPELNFSGLDELITAIHDDIAYAKEKLDSEVCLSIKEKLLTSR